MPSLTPLRRTTSRNTILRTASESGAGIRSSPSETAGTARRHKQRATSALPPERGGAELNGAIEMPRPGSGADLHGAIIAHNAQGLQLSVQSRAFHPDKSCRTRDVAAESGHLS